MVRNGNRVITVDKAKLIAKVKENKENHIKEYKEAVVAYKEEALRQLAEQTAAAEEGNLNIRLNLTSPVNAEEDYDKIIDMFEWEVNDQVELAQNEFLEYIQDDTSWARAAKMSNAFYTSAR